MSIASAVPETSSFSWRAARPRVAIFVAVLANLSLMYGLMYSPLIWRWKLLVAAHGIICAQAYLLSLWLAFGRDAWIVRLPLVAATGMALGHAVRIRVPDVSPWWEFWLVGGIVVTFVLCMHALLLPWRWLGATNLAFASNAAPMKLRPRQIGIRHLLAWMVWWLIPCALARSLTGENAFAVLFGIGIFGLLALPLALTTTLAVFGRRKLLWLFAVMAAGAFAVGVKQFIPDFFDTPRVWEFTAAVVVVVAANLIVLRWCGLTMRFGSSNQPARTHPD